MLKDYIKQNLKLTNTNGVIPMKWWNNDDLRQFNENHQGNHSFVLENTHLIVDVDIKNNKNGLESFERLQKDLGINLKKTVITKSGGFHCYLTKPKSIDIQTHLKQYPHIDFLSKNQCVIIAGSQVDSKHYKYANDDLGLFFQDCPESLLKLLRVKKTKNNTNESKYTKAQVLGFLENIDSDCDYGAWVKIGMALKHFDKTTSGLEMWETWSQLSKKYKDGECEKKWDTFANDKNNIVTVKTLHKMSNEVLCKDVEAEKNAWYTNYVYVLALKKYVNLDDLWQYDVVDFDIVNTKFIKRTSKNKPKMNASKFVKDNDLLKIVKHAMYLPNVDSKFTMIKNTEVLNLFDKNTLPKSANVISENGEKAIAKIKAHIEFLCNDDKKDTETLLSWFAHNVQNMGKRLTWTPIIQGSQGVGKSTLTHLLKNILGDQNVGIVSTSQAISQYNGWAENKSVNVIEELKISGSNRHIAANAIKPLFTDENIQVVDKYVKAHEVINVTNYICFTNFKDAVPLDDDDRRWFVVNCYTNVDVVSTIESKFNQSISSYFNELYNAINNYSPEIKKWLMDYEIPTFFKQLKRAPMTNAKLSAIATEKQSIEWLSEIEGLINEGGEFFNTLCVSTSDLFTQAMLKYVEMPNLDNFAKNKIMKKLGFSALPKVVKINGKTRTIWAKRHMENSEVRKSFEKVIKNT